MTFEMPVVTAADAEPKNKLPHAPAPSSWTEPPCCDADTEPDGGIQNGLVESSLADSVETLL